MIYCVTATVERKANGTTSLGQIPTFFLDSRIQGIRSVAHAKFIAEEIINPFRIKGVKVHVDAMKASAIEEV